MSKPLDLSAQFEALQLKISQLEGALAAKEAELSAVKAAAPAPRVGLFPMPFDPAYDAFKYRQILPNGLEFHITGNRGKDNRDYLSVDYNVRWIAAPGGGKKRPTRGLSGTVDQVAYALKWLHENPDASADWLELKAPPTA